MPLETVLIANRGEIAVRIARACAEAGLRSVAVYAEDDAGALHTVRADDACPLPGRGARAYLDAGALIEAAREARCDAVHPGYGFLSESAAFARACADAGLTFIGPRPDTLDLFGDKARARDFAASAGVPVLPGTAAGVSAEDVRAFLASLGEEAAVAIKAVAGGGGRGMRVVTAPDEIAAAHTRCASEAQSAFGDAALYAEKLVPRARHIEVQALGDRAGDVAHLWERDCTLQRRHQKVVEVAPAPGLAPGLRARMIDAALTLARAASLENLCTFEFLVEGAGDVDDAAFWFIEANPRLQVEHTVTEEITGADLVRAQFALAEGRTLADIGLASPPEPRGIAVQLRINAERMRADGSVVPSGGRIVTFEAPGGPGLRVDTHAYAGYVTNPAFDPLLAKLVVHEPSGEWDALLRRAYRALCELRIEGVDTNVPFLQALVRHAEVAAGRAYTRFVEDHLPQLLAGAETAHPRLYVSSREATGAAPGLAGARLATDDPLAVLEHGKSAPPAGRASVEVALPEGFVAVRAPLQGTVIAIDVGEGDAVRAGQQIAVMEAMKMEHIVRAEHAGRVQRITVAAGDAVFEGHTLMLIETAEHGAADEGAGEAEPDLDAVRPDLAESIARHHAGLDAARGEAVARHHAIGHRSARENIDDLCDPGSFVEYGPLVIAAQRRRRSIDDLIANTPADGMVAGIGTVNADLFDEAAARVIAMSYDYTVLAGTQGAQNHRKKDRMFELAERWRLPIVFFTEGGGGRPGDTDGLGVAGLDVMAFHYFGRLSGLVPLVGVVAGRCFAGNAAILGCCDVVIATRDANIGMGGPAMVEGGGLGVFRPEEIGPVDVQAANGVIDVLVEDEAEAVRVAKQYLSYFQGRVRDWTCADQRRLRSVVPENRRRVYDVRAAIETLADTGSVLELRRHFGAGMITALARVEGRPVGIFANNPMHLAGAIDSDAADKAARFMQLCDAFGIPLLSLCDTPGIMVGPEVEKTALVRHAARMFVTGAGVSVPQMTIVLRKAYGLGAQAMAGGSFKAPLFCVSWPTGEFGGMGLEGAVKLGYRNELAAIDDPAERKATFDAMVARMYEHGKALNTASHFEIDDVIDPADSRRWITAALRALPPEPPRAGKRRPNIDTW